MIFTENGSLRISEVLLLVIDFSILTCVDLKRKNRISYFHFGAVSLPLFWFNFSWILLLLGIKWSYFVYFVPGLTHVAFLFHFFTFRKFIDYMSLSELTNGFILIRPLIAKIKSNSILFLVCDTVFVIVQVKWILAMKCP